MIAVRVSVTRKGDLEGHIRKIEAALKGPKNVDVGLPKGKAASNVIEYAVYNHEGTTHIPRRPFVTVAMFKGRGKIRTTMRKIAKNVVQAKAALPPQMEKLGMLGAGMIQDQIASNMGPALKPSTIRQKGSSRTLIDTGRMRQSVTHHVK